MKTAWLVLLISAATDFVITAAGGAMTVLTVYVTQIQNQISAGKPPAPVEISWVLFMPSILLGVISLARTIQQALKATPETLASLTGGPATVAPKA